MKLAIMQPYFFPYIGYFQLINAVDTFVIYDDVNYINKGWINRNNILVNGKSNLITFPLKNASQNKLINETEISEGIKNAEKLLKTIELNYKKAPFFKEIYYVLADIILLKSADIATFNLKGINAICNYLSVSTKIVSTSAIYNNTHLKAQHRILDICKQEAATHYINPIGGMEIYSKELFVNSGILLNFIKAKPFEYKQFKNEFVPWLSIIDVMMFNAPDNIKKMLNQYELI